VSKPGFKNTGTRIAPRLHPQNKFAPFVSFNPAVTLIMHYKSLEYAISRQKTYLGDLSFFPSLIPLALEPNNETTHRAHPFSKNPGYTPMFELSEQNVLILYIWSFLSPPRCGFIVISDPSATCVYRHKRAIEV